MVEQRFQFNFLDSLVSSPYIDGEMAAASVSGQASAVILVRQRSQYLSKLTLSLESRGYRVRNVASDVPFDIKVPAIDADHFSVSIRYNLDHLCSVIWQDH